MKKLIFPLFLFQYFFSIAQHQPVRLTSPDGHIDYTFEVSNGKMFYNVAYKKISVITKSPMGLVSRQGDCTTNMVLVKTPVYHDSTEAYDLIVGKTKHVDDRFREAIISLQQRTGTQLLNIHVKVFNDGVAFRYEFPTQRATDTLLLLDENSGFNLSGNPTALTLYRENYTTSHEGFYSSVPLASIPEDTLMDLPALFQFPQGIFVGITEAALLDYAGMYLAKHNGILTSRLSPLPKQTAVKVKAILPHQSPWRVLLISNRVGALIESNMITSLNKPTAIKDISWIKPGKSSWTWWNGNIMPDTNFAPGNNFDFNKYYIDFCASNKIEYHSVIEYGNREWYLNEDGNGFEPGPGADVTKPVKGLDMKAICDYAKSKGVDIRVWVHWAALFPQPKLDSAFTVLERWGVKGLMIDFMDRDDQDMVNMQTEMLQKAADHHLHIQFHGAYKPTGLSRTYPNEFTREGTLNYEVDKWSPDGINADHDLNMPFTRMLAGPTDYHLGGFRAVTRENFKVQFTRPLVLSTRCHMLAMYVVLESYLGLVSDYPEAYAAQPGFQFIKEVPTVWDETKVLDAKVGSYISIARRKNQDWYTGTITNHEHRQVAIPLKFLGPGSFTADIYRDAPETDKNPNHLQQETKIVSAADVITLQLAPNGGGAIHFHRN